MARRRQSPSTLFSHVAHPLALAEPWNSLHCSTVRQTERPSTADLRAVRMQMDSSNLTWDHQAAAYSPHGLVFPNKRGAFPANPGLGTGNHVAHGSGCCLYQ